MMGDLPKYKEKGKRGLEGALKRMVEGSKARSKGSEGSKAHSKEVEAQRHTQKRGRVRKRTTLDGQGLKGALERR